jgi:hypothetical protein
MPVSRTSRGHGRAAELKRLQIQWQKGQVAQWIAERRPKGWMAKELGVVPSAITRLCKELEREWRTEYLDDLLTHKAAELAAINRREAFCWEQLYKSMEIRRQDQQFTDCEGESTVTTTLAGRAGLTKRGQATKMQMEVADPRWMAEIRACSEQRCSLLGLNEEVELKISLTYFDKFSPAELLRLAAGEPFYIVERDCDERVQRERLRGAEPAIEVTAQPAPDTGDVA